MGQAKSENKILIIATILLCLSGRLFAGGSISFLDLKELLEEQPALAHFISEHLDLAPIGNATRIGGRVNEELSGSRVAPYEFEAKPKGAKGDFNLLLVIEAKTTFLDRNGKETGVAKATQIKERLTGICLRPLSANVR